MARNRNTKNKRNNANSAKSKCGVDTNQVSTKTDVASTASDTSAEAKEKDEGKNDPAWYTKMPVLAEGAAKIPWNLPFGAQFVWGSKSKSAIPGICVLKTKPTFGFSMDIKSPLNVAAISLYANVRHAVSGRKNYDASDLMMYCLSISEIYSFLTWCIRAYNLAYMASQQNYYFGRACLEADGWNVDDLVNNLANFRYLINVMINKVGSYAVPKDIDLFNRRAFMYSNVYMENPYGNIKDQLYMFSPDGFHRFALAKDVHVGTGKLEYGSMTVGIGTKNIAYIRDMFDWMVENITNDEDFALMSGDIYKAYGEAIIGLSDVPEAGGILPVYDAMVLSQFKNASIHNVIRRKKLDGTGTFALNYRDKESCVFGDVYQTAGGQLLNIEGILWPTADDAVAASGRELETFENMERVRVPFTVENPKPDIPDVMEATRLSALRWEVGYDKFTPSLDTKIVWDDVTDKKGWSLLTCGTDIVVECLLCTMELSEQSPIVTSVRFTSNEIIGLEGQTTIADLSKLNFLISSFKYAPIILSAARGTLKYRPPESEMHADWPICNFDNTIEMYYDVLYRIHEAALLSLFYIPGVAKIL